MVQTTAPCQGYGLDQFQPGAAPHRPAVMWLNHADVPHTGWGAPGREGRLAVRRQATGQPLVIAPERVQRSVLASSTYEAIKQLIMDNRLAAGSRISMDGLARDLGVSPTPVREALARLDADGLVSKRPLVGYTVAPLLDRAAFEDLFAMRLLLEPQAARLAAARVAANQALRDEITAAAAAMATIPKGSGYAAYREQAAADARFHDAIASASGSPLLRESIDRLRSHMHLYRLYWRSGIAAETVHEHDRIVKALQAGEAETAAEAMLAHIRASHARLAQFADPA
jgi:DNA-binding GntR family transcriptional regulator